MRSKSIEDRFKARSRGQTHRKGGKKRDGMDWFFPPYKAKNSYTGSINALLLQNAVASCKEVKSLSCTNTTPEFLLIHKKKDISWLNTDSDLLNFHLCSTFNNSKQETNICARFSERILLREFRQVSKARRKNLTSAVNWILRYVSNKISCVLWRTETEQEDMHLQYLKYVCNMQNAFVSGRKWILKRLLDSYYGKLKM